MKQNHTDITMVLDRSGSMSSVREDTIGGFNQFLEDQCSAPGSAAVTLHQFDHEFETLIKAQDVKSAPKLTTATFKPRGNTALLDAIGRAIIDTGARIESAAAGERPEKVVFVIITDGHENASHEYDKAKVFEMIKHQREKYAWEFVFIGSNQDAIATASGIGISGANAITTANTPLGARAVYASTSKNLRSMRCGEKQDMSFTPKDRADQEAAK